MEEQVTGTCGRYAILEVCEAAHRDARDGEWLTLNDDEFTDQDHEEILMHIGALTDEIRALIIQEEFSRKRATAIIERVRALGTEDPVQEGCQLCRRWYANAFRGYAKISLTGAHSDHDGR